MIFIIVLLGGGEYYWKSHEPRCGMEKKLPQYRLLTSRTLDVANQLLNGRIEKEIASDLNIEVSTVRYHKKKLFEFFQVNSVSQVIKELIVRNMIRCEDNSLIIRETTTEANE